MYSYLVVQVNITGMKDALSHVRTWSVFIVDEFFKKSMHKIGVLFRISVYKLLHRILLSKVLYQIYWLTVNTFDPIWCGLKMGRSNGKAPPTSPWGFPLGCCCSGGEEKPVAVLSTLSLTKPLVLLVDAVIGEAILVAFRLGFRYLSTFFILVHSY